jgi:hypothetical protein
VAPGVDDSELLDGRDGGFAVGSLIPARARGRCGSGLATLADVW